jgi:hypothetical protein
MCVVSRKKIELSKLAYAFNPAILGVGRMDKERQDYFYFYLISFTDASTFCVFSHLKNTV